MNISNSPRVLCVAPHPDDETLGVGGTLLRRKSEGAVVGWLIVTNISTQAGWNEEKVKRRAAEIEKVQRLYEFDKIYALNFNTTELDQIPIGKLVESFSKVFKEFEPEEVFVPHPADAHTDHGVVFNAVTACTKWFRYPSVERVLAYETLSESEFGLGTEQAFRPNVFINIEQFIDKKIKIMKTYDSEVNNFPFPRSDEAILALAKLRGAASGFKAAEAFELLRERG